MTDYNKICRTCLRSIETIQYCLFENVSPEMYWFCTSIEVKTEETISRALCTTCYEKLIKFCAFKKVCVQSYKSLLGHEENPKCLYNEECPHKNIDVLKQETGSKKVIFDDIKADLMENYHNDHSYDDNMDDDTAVFAEPLETSNKDITHKRVKMKHIKEETFTCDVCNRNFVSEKRLKTHKLSHETKKVQKTLQCVPCNKKFLTHCGLRRHEATWHSRVRLASVSCGTCGKVARSRDSLRVHLKLHAHRQRHICSVCGKAYSSSVGLKTHLEIHQENRERQCTCEYCGKKFYTKKTLSGHVTRCHTGRRFICQICSFPFTDKYNLAKHLQIHEGRKLHKCKICEKSFATVFAYDEHQRIHSGERPFSCTYCPKSFLSKKRLIEHHRIHTGEKPHKCSICARGFTQRGTMKRHMKIHDKVPVL